MRPIVITAFMTAIKLIESIIFPVKQFIHYIFAIIPDFSLLF